MIRSALFATVLLATPAVAQSVPAYQLGSGTTAGGPARELNYGGQGPILVDPATDLATVQTGGRTHGFDVGPAFQRGSGMRAGGPAGELNRGGQRPLLFAAPGLDLGAIQGGGRTHGVH